MKQKHPRTEPDVDTISAASYTRRSVLGLMAAAGLVPLVGCGDGGSTPDGGNGEGGTGDGGIADNGGTDTGGTDTGGVDTTPAESWATGGTKSMTAKSSYPDPFTAAAASCMLVATTTEGPCTTSTDLEREDISEGNPGLPVRLGLRVVDTSCAPLAGATVRIWHTNAEGSYSGQTPNNNMCLKDQSYSSTDFFRGVQKTDANGVVFFDTCFPGWYRGRAVHIHFQIKNGNTSTRISQLFFPEDTTKEIFSDHSEYSSFGQPDTTFSNDNIMGGIPQGERDRHIVAVARMSDGAMLASKTVTVS